jgi:hypothetical protein
VFKGLIYHVKHSFQEFQLNSSKDFSYRKYPFIFTKPPTTVKKKDWKAVLSSRGKFYVRLSLWVTNICQLKCSIRFCRDGRTNSLPRNPRSLRRTALARLLSRAYRKTLKPFVFTHSLPCVHIYPPFSANPCEFCFVILSRRCLSHILCGTACLHDTVGDWARGR